MTASTWDARLRAARGAGIRIVAREPATVGDEVVAEFTKAAERLGYVAVDAHRDLEEAQRRRLWHRHVALIHSGEATPASVRWVRELAHASPRAHVVLAITPHADRAHEGTPMEMPALGESGVSGPGPLEARAIRQWQRRRTASAIRWSGAAVERAHRATDELGAARAFSRLTEYSDTSSIAASAGLIDRGRRLLLPLGQLAPRSHVVAALVDIWFTHGEFEAAAAALAGIEVECMLSLLAVPPWIRGRQCELASWQGHWDDAEEWSRASALFGWRALAAFARRDWELVRTLAVAVSAQPEAHGEWRPLLSLMAASLSEGTHEIETLVEHARGHDQPRRWRDALVLECLRVAGVDAEAAAWIKAMDARPRGPAEQLLWRWCCSGGGHVSALEADVRRLGADGIRRWGHRRSDMQVWAGVSSLLNQVQEAEDAGSAMRRGCRWAREYTGVDAVGIQSVDGAMLASDPEQYGRTDWTSGRKEAVRYGGVRIGDVVLQGAPGNTEEARAVATALATACAPAVRARLDDLLVLHAGDTLAGELLGVSPGMKGLRDAIARAAGSTFPVLIEGESGTGKELVARALHRLSPRRDRRWAAVNCAALTDELLEAELFGHVRGAFTGAVGPRLGLLEDAHEGTLFLDEVAELSPRGQAKLLRVLQEGEIRRVGENVTRRVDVRLVAATNRSLTDVARSGGYREDLIFRLAVIRLRVPPLRERVEDVPILAHAFWKNTSSRVASRALLAPDAIAALCRAAWPGNVRELQNVIAALAVGGPSRGRIGARDVAAVLADRAHSDAMDPPVSLARARALSDRRVVTTALARHAHQRAAAARELGVSRQGLAKLIARLQLEAAPAGPATAVASEGAFRRSSAPRAALHDPSLVTDCARAARGGDAGLLAAASRARGSRAGHVG